ncbi:hypothetical protein P8452_42621 [Trifolium repens]|jgi:hypothetical protein|nr:hypothetical protein P8452_42621 [Trifolium repens]
MQIFHRNCLKPWQIPENNDARHRCFCQHNSVLILCDEINKLLLLEEESLHVVAVTVDLEGGFAIKKNEGGFAAMSLQHQHSKIL